MKERQITGRQVFVVTASAFAVIIGVNLTLAWKAVATFPGLEARNSYVASQSFDADRAAQEALGWDVTAEFADGDLVLEFRDRSGHAIRPESLSATLGRATHVADDSVPAFVWTGDAFRAPAEPELGNWNLRLIATAADGTEFRRRIVLYVKRPG